MVTPGKKNTRNRPVKISNMPSIAPPIPNICINIYLATINKYTATIAGKGLRDSMVFARTKLTLEDNCFVEEPGAVTIRFVGPDVTKIYKKVYELMKSVFRVPDSAIQEVEYNWAKGEKGDKFKVTWWLHKDMDLFSYLYIRFRLWGEGNGTGNAKLEIRSLLRSEYPQDTVWQRSLFYEMLRTLWHRIFYHKKREEYAEECRHSVVLFMKHMRKFLQQLRGEVKADVPPAAEEEVKKTGTEDRAEAKPKGT